MIFRHFQRVFMPFEQFLIPRKSAQNQAKSKRYPPYYFGQFWPVFQLFKNGSKGMVKPLERFSCTSNVFLCLLDQFLNSGKSGPNLAQSEG